MKTTKKRKTEAKATNRVKNVQKVRTARLRGRLGLVGAFMGCVLIVLIIRIGYYALVKGEEFEREVYTRMVSTEQNIEALRGEILDVNHKVIANSELVYHIILDPIAILGVSEESRQNTYKELAAYTGKTVQEISDLVTNNSETHYRILQKRISAEDMEMLKKKRLKGVWFEESFIRTYPKDSLAAQSIGFYNGTSGQYGVEQYHDSYLQGKKGRVFPKLQDGNIVTTEVAPAKSGNTVVITIDEVIQQYVDQAMDKYVKEHSPLNASAIFMNPNTGEIYAMYSYPYFDPNKYTNLEEQMGKAKWDALSAEQQSAELNRAWKNYNIQNPYEPGSTFKPMVIAAALEEGIINKDDHYNCTGNNFVADKNIRCWKRSGHGMQTLEQALANSCNTAMIEIASKMPTEVFYEYMVNFGLGEPTFVDLPGEANGIIHNLAGLGPVEKATASMGQGFTITPLQLLTAFSAVVNGGDLVQPYITSQVLDEDNNVLLENNPVIKRQVISQQTSDILREFMQSVITYGTGVEASVAGYTVGGKTGTAQKLPREAGTHIYSFVQYAPVENPQIIGLVLFDEIPDGTGAPSKAISEIMTSVLPYMGIETTDSPDSPAVNRSVVPSVENLSIYDGINTLASEQLNYEVIGVGNKIVNQYPAPGTKLPQDTVVKIYLETSAPEAIQEVPELMGLTVEEARKVTNGAFKLEGSESGIIKEQIPKAGTKIEKDSKIIVQTSE